MAHADQDHWHCTALVLAEHIPTGQTIAGVRFRKLGDDEEKALLYALRSVNLGPLRASGRNLAVRSRSLQLETDFVADVEVKGTDATSVAKTAYQRIQTVLGLVTLAQGGSGAIVDVAGCSLIGSSSVQGSPLQGAITPFGEPNENINVEILKALLNSYNLDLAFAEAYKYWRDGWYRMREDDHQIAFLLFFQSFESCTTAIQRIYSSEFKTMLHARQELMASDVLRMIHQGKSDLVIKSVVTKGLRQAVSYEKKLLGVPSRATFAAEKLGVHRPTLNAALNCIRARNAFSHNRSDRAEIRSEDVEQMEQVARAYLLALHERHYGDRSRKESVGNHE